MQGKEHEEVKTLRSELEGSIVGNRATIVFITGDSISPATYLHWNGGPESVYAFLAEMDRREIPKTADLEAARFAQIVGEFFDEDLSLYSTNGPAVITEAALGQVKTDHRDNGFYIVDRYRNTVRRFTLNRNSLAAGSTNWGKLEEWTPEQVKRERDLATAHEYADGIADFYAQRRASRRLVDEGERVE